MGTNQRSTRISIRTGEFAATFADAERTLGLLRDQLGDKIDVRAPGGLSAARGLQELAEDEGADLIVVGSTARGRRGRTLPGTTADPVLNGAPCEVPWQTLEQLTDGVRVHGELIDGPAVDVLHQRTADLDLFVMGSVPTGRYCGQCSPASPTACCWTPFAPFSCCREGPRRSPKAVSVGARAREEGITTFTALMLATNQQMMDVLMALARVRVIDRELGTVEIEMPIPKVGLSPVLRKLLVSLRATT